MSIRTLPCGRPGELKSEYVSFSDGLPVHFLHQVHSSFRSDKSAAQSISSLAIFLQAGPSLSVTELRIGACDIARQGMSHSAMSRAVTVCLTELPKEFLAFVECECLFLYLQNTETGLYVFTSAASKVHFWYYSPVFLRGTAVAQWSRRRATNRKVACSIPDGVIGFFHWRNPSDRTMALGSTQPLTEMSTMSISWGQKAAGCKADNLTTILGHCHVMWEP